MSEEYVTRLSLWSGPRNVSTALMYAFAQREDTRVFDEPLYAHYLTHESDRPAHPGESSIVASQDTNGESVVRNVLLGPASKPVLFFKNMAHHLVDLDWGFLDSLTNVILTREPRDMLHSYSKTIPDFTIRDTGYLKLKRICDSIVARGGEPLVVDSRTLLQSPESVLKALCSRVGIPFTSSMLSWPAGPKEDDGVWAPHWYRNVHLSTGFTPYAPKKEPFPEWLNPMLEECQGLYDSLLPWALR